jgi:hypothetical protein
MAMKAALMIVTAVAAASCGVAVSSGSSPPTLACDQIIDSVASGRVGGDRVVLGVVSVPPRYLSQVVESGEPAPWRYWRKAGLVVRAGSPAVSVSVSPGSRDRAALTWGNSSTVSALRIASCPALPGKPWNAYAGGFMLRNRAACVSLTIRVGARRQAVLFGLGRRCP